MNTRSPALEGKVAIVTGGGRGIGAAIAEKLAQEQARVIIASRSADELDSTKEKITSECPSSVVECIPTDVSEENEVRALFRMTLKKFGHCDILVNNAAIVIAKPFLELTTEDWDQTMKINLRGAYFCAREAFAVMREQRSGAIINISSLAGLQTTQKIRGLSAYSVSKFGITGLTEVLAEEGKEFGIRVNAVAPGAIETEMLKKAAPKLRTNAKPHDVAEVVLFLADENRSKVMTGAVVPIYSNSHWEN